jgi:hypothetical protein
MSLHSTWNWWWWWTPKDGCLSQLSSAQLNVFQSIHWKYTCIYKLAIKSKSTFSLCQSARVHSSTVGIRCNGLHVGNSHTPTLKPSIKDFVVEFIKHSLFYLHKTARQTRARTEISLVQSTLSQVSSLWLLCLISSEYPFLFNKILAVSLMMLGSSNVQDEVINIPFVKDQWTIPGDKSIFNLLEKKFCLPPQFPGLFLVWQTNRSALIPSLLPPVPDDDIYFLLGILKTNDFLGCHHLSIERFFDRIHPEFFWSQTRNSLKYYFLKLHQLWHHNHPVKERNIHWNALVARCIIGWVGWWDFSILVVSFCLIEIPPLPLILKLLYTFYCFYGANINLFRVSSNRQNDICVQLVLGMLQMSVFTFDSSQFRCGTANKWYWDIQ